MLDGLPNIVDDSCGMLCDNKIDFENELFKLLEDENYYNEKSKNAIIKSKKLENIDNYINNLFNIYINGRRK